MRLIYLCDQCNSYIDEIELPGLDETLLGFDTLTDEEREEILSIDWVREEGTVRAICDSCLSMAAPAVGLISQSPVLH